MDTIYYFHSGIEYPSLLDNHKIIVHSYICLTDNNSSYLGNCKILKAWKGMFISIILIICFKSIFDVYN